MRKRRAWAPSTLFKNTASYSRHFSVRNIFILVVAGLLLFVAWRVAQPPSSYLCRQVVMNMTPMLICLPIVTKDLIKVNIGKQDTALDMRR